MSTKEIVTIASNAIHAKLHEAPRHVKLEVQRVLSYRVEGSEHSVAFKSGNWDGRSSFLDFRTGSFPAGFTYLVAAHLRRNGYEVRHVKKPFPEPLGPEKPKVDSFPDDPRYDYQMDVVDRLVKHGQIIAQVATGGGKSRIARLAFSRINRPTLFLTTRGILMYQMKDAFENDLKVKCSVLGDGQFGHTNNDGKAYVKKMSVGMVQTLVSRLEEGNPERELEKLMDAAEKRGEKLNLKEAKPIVERKVSEQNAIREQTINLLSKFEFVILEEAHEASGNSYYEILKHCKNAHYRLALTATPFMKENEESNMRLMACSGPIAIKITEKMLIDRGILAKPFFKIIGLNTLPPKLHRHTAWQAAYRLGVVDNIERNKHVVREALRAQSIGLSTMILVQQTKHGETLLNMIKDAGLRAEFIQGADNQKERKKALTALAKKNIDVLIGTTILDVGVDVPAVGMIILAGGGKAEVALRQRIGRGLRAKKHGPNVAFIIDFDDPHNNYLKTHATQRKAIIADTEGFGENIVDHDFDFRGLGLM